MNYRKIAKFVFDSKITISNRLNLWNTLKLTSILPKLCTLIKISLSKPSWIISAKFNCSIIFLINSSIFLVSLAFELELNWLLSNWSPVVYAPRQIEPDYLTSHNINWGNYLKKQLNKRFSPMFPSELVKSINFLKNRWLFTTCASEKGENKKT